MLRLTPMLRLLFPWAMGILLVFGLVYSYVNVENAFGYEWASSFMAKNSIDYVRSKQFADLFEHRALWSLMVVIFSGFGLFLPRIFRSKPK